MPSNQHGLTLLCSCSAAHPMQQLSFIKNFHLAFLCTVYIARAKLLSPCCKEKGDCLGLHGASSRVRVLSARFLSSDLFPVLPLVLYSTFCISNSPLLRISTVCGIYPREVFISKLTPGDTIQPLPEWLQRRRWRNGWGWARRASNGNHLPARAEPGQWGSPPVTH